MKTRWLVGLLMAVTLGACQRAPQNASELMSLLPRQFSGEVHWQGEGGVHRVRIECREFAVRSEHALEFAGVNLVQLGENGSVLNERYVPCRGVISAPGFQIKLEDLGAPGGEDMLKPGTFVGKLSEDLQTAEASWTTGFGTKGVLKLKAATQ